MWKPFTVVPTKREFSWSRRAVGTGEKGVASNLSAIWTPAWQETLIGGVLQGRKQVDPRGASAICRRGMWKVAVQFAAAVGVVGIQQVLGKRRYADVKSDRAFDDRRSVKRSMIDKGLNGWVKNAGDDDWSLEAKE